MEIPFEEYRRRRSALRIIGWFIAFVATAGAGFGSLWAEWTGAAFLSGVLFGLSAHMLGKAHRAELLRRKYG
jgi:hypothetical protein